MAHRVEIHDRTFESLVLIFDSGEIGSDNRTVQAIDKALRAWRKVSDLDEFNFTRTNSGLFSYEIKHKDQREWTGQVNFNDNTVDPHIFMVRADNWTLRESERPDLRAAIIDAVNKLDLVSIEVTFA